MERHGLNLRVPGPDTATIGPIPSLPVGWITALPETNGLASGNHDTTCQVHPAPGIPANGHAPRLDDVQQVRAERIGLDG